MHYKTKTPTKYLILVLKQRQHLRQSLSENHKEDFLQACLKYSFFFLDDWVLNRAELHVLRTAKDTLWDLQMTWREVHHLFAAAADPKGSTEVSGIICFITGILIHNVKVPRLRQVLRCLWPSTPPPFHSWVFYLAISGFGSTKTLTNRKKR